MAVRIGQMKIALAPLGVAGRGQGLMAGFKRTLVEDVDIADVEDDASPPRPLLLLALRDQVEITRSDAKAGKGSRLAAVAHVESERTVKADGTCHIVGSKRDGADAFN